jgi:hypothetical protein
MGVLETGRLLDGAGDDSVAADPRVVVDGLLGDEVDVTSAAGVSGSSEDVQPLTRTAPPASPAPRKARRVPVWTQVMRRCRS